MSLEIDRGMRALYGDTEQIIVRLDNGTIVILKEEEIILKYRIGNARKTKKFGYIDMIKMNDLICEIMQPVIDERNKLKQNQNIILNVDKVEMEFSVDPSIYPPKSLSDILKHP